MYLLIRTTQNISPRTFLENNKTTGHTIYLKHWNIPWNDLPIHIGKGSLELDSYLINYWQFVNKTWIYHRSLKGQTKTHLYFHIYIIIYTIKIFWSTSIKRDLQWNEHILTRNIYIMILKKEADVDFPISLWYLIQSSSVAEF